MSAEGVKHGEASVWGAGGSQGGNGLEKLAKDVWQEDWGNGLAGKPGNELEEVFGVESDPGRAEELAEEYQENDLVTIINETAADYIEKRENSEPVEIIEKDGKNTISREVKLGELEGLQFDAVSTSERLGANGTTRKLASEISSREKLAYWSEKPADVERLEELDAQGIPASMDLIENFSLQKQAVIQDIEQEGYEVDSIRTWRTSKPQKMVESDRPIIRTHGGATKDKLPHDIGNAVLTLEASGQLEDFKFSNDSEYFPAHIELGDRLVAYTESGEEIEVDSEDYGSERVNDGFSRVLAESGGADLEFVGATAGFPEGQEEKIDEELDEVYDSFREGVEEELGDVDLKVGDPGNEEIRVEHLEAENGDVEYLVSTYGEMFTLKKDSTGPETEYELLAHGGQDFLAEYLQEGLDAANGEVDRTISMEAAVRTMNEVDRAAEFGYENRGEPMVVDAPEGSELYEVLNR